MPESHPRPGKARILSKIFYGIRVGRRCLDGESVEFVPHWRYPRLPILPQGRPYHQTMTTQPPLPQRSQLRVLLRKLLPVHVKASEIKKTRSRLEILLFSRVRHLNKYTGRTF